MVGMNKLTVTATLDERIEHLFQRVRRINARKNPADCKAAIRSAFKHLLGSAALRDGDADGLRRPAGRSS